MLRSSICLLALSLLATTAWPATADAEVRRCVQPDGDVSYTDHRCAEIGAVERPPEHNDSANRLYRGGCPRTVPDLLFEMTQAIESRDVNHLASLYHWADMSSGEATAVMNRLDTLVQQPLVDIVPVMSAPSASFAGYDPAAAGVRTGSTPVAVRIEQTLADSITPSQTVFGLHRYFGCLWIRGRASARPTHAARAAHGAQ